MWRNVRERIRVSRTVSVHVGVKMARSILDGVNASIAEDSNAGWLGRHKDRRAYSQSPTAREQPLSIPNRQAQLRESRPSSPGSLFKSWENTTHLGNKGDHATDAAMAAVAARCDARKQQQMSERGQSRAKARVKDMLKNSSSAIMEDFRAPRPYTGDAPSEDSSSCPPIPGAVSDAEIAGVKSEKRKAQIRERFLNKAKSLVGVRYSSIDCCGLVRKCVHALPKEFPFRLDVCNQGVMFEMLNGQGGVISQQEMKPGDLIFYKAQYVDKMKQMKRNGIVHVEIYLGGGRSVGSRDDGWIYEGEHPDMGRCTEESGVKIYKTWRVLSRRWERRPAVEHFFRSIDPWMEDQVTVAQVLPADIRHLQQERGFNRLSNGEKNVFIADRASLKPAGKGQRGGHGKVAIEGGTEEQQEQAQRWADGRWGKGKPKPAVAAHSGESEYAEVAADGKNLSKTQRAFLEVGSLDTVTTARYALTAPQHATIHSACAAAACSDFMSRCPVSRVRCAPPAGGGQCRKSTRRACGRSCSQGRRRRVYHRPGRPAPALANHRGPQRDDSNDGGSNGEKAQQESEAHGSPGHWCYNWPGGGLVGGLGGPCSHGGRHRPRSSGCEHRCEHRC